MIEQNSGKVKNKIAKVLSTSYVKFSLPHSKYLKEMVTGTLASMSLNLSEIARSLKEATSVKHVEKRLQRNTSECRGIMQVANERSMKEAKREIDRETYIYLDGGDITYSQATSYSNMTTVYDGSTKRLRPGYLLNLVVYRDKRGEVTPICLDMFHRLVGYKSDNDETYKTIDKVTAALGEGKGIWTLDRGYDNFEIMKHIMSKGCSFLVRLTSKRNLFYKGESVPVKKLCDGINRRYGFNGGHYGYRKCYVGKLEVTLIYFVNKRGNYLMLLHSGHIGKSSSAKFAIEAYFKRWGIEEAYKFIKQSFGIEKAQVRKFEGIRNLMGIVHFAWQVLKEISGDRELKMVTEAASKQIKKGVVCFCFYRIVNGIKKIFSFCKELYRYRQRSKRKHPHFFTLEDYLNKYDNKYSLC
jgi:hypothetical protein